MGLYNTTPWWGTWKEICTAAGLDPTIVDFDEAPVVEPQKVVDDTITEVVPDERQLRLIIAGVQSEKGLSEITGEVNAGSKRFDEDAILTWVKKAGTNIAQANKGVPNPLADQPGSSSKGASWELHKDLDLPSTRRSARAIVGFADRIDDKWFTGFLQKFSGGQTDPDWQDITNLRALTTLSGDKPGADDFVVPDSAPEFTERLIKAYELLEGGRSDAVGAFAEFISAEHAPDEAADWTSVLVRMRPLNPVLYDEFLRISEVGGPDAEKALNAKRSELRRTFEDGATALAPASITVQAMTRAQTNALAEAAGITSGGANEAAATQEERDIQSFQLNDPTGELRNLGALAYQHGFGDEFRSALGRFAEKVPDWRDELDDVLRGAQVQATELEAELSEI